jgi:hypothetical protein
MSVIEPFQSERPSRWIGAVAVAVCAASAVVVLHIAALSVAALATTWIEFGLQDDVVPLEGEIIYLARLAQRSEPVYLDYRKLPFAPAAYGPLAYYSIGWIGRWGNVDALGLYRIGRAASLVASIGTVILLWLATPSLPAGRKWLAKLLAVGIFLVGTCPFNTGGWPLIAMHMAAAARPDAVGVMLGLAGCILVSRGRVLWAIPLFVVATLFKHIYVVGPAATLVWLLIRGERRTLVTFALIWAAAEVVVWSLAVALCGRALLLNLTMFGHVPWAWGTAPLNLWALRSTFALPLAAAVVYWISQLRTKSFDLAAVYMFLAFLVGFVTISKVGGANNHFLEFVVAASWCAGLWAARMSAAAHGRTCYAPGEPNAAAHRVLPVSLLCILAAGLVSMDGTRQQYFGWLRTATRAVTKFAGVSAGPPEAEVTIPESTFYRMVLAEPFGGPLLTSDSRLSALSDKEAVALDWLIWSMLIEQGTVDLEPVLARVRSQEFELVVLHFDPSWPTQMIWGGPAWPPRLAEAIRDHYHLKRVIGRFHLLTPKPPAETIKPPPATDL